MDSSAPLNDNKFYNYVLLDPRKPGDYNYGDLHFDFEPFYVGKGNGRRAYHHKYPSNKSRFKDNKIKKILSLGFDLIVLKIYENLSEVESFDNEINLIKQIGRSNLGPLTNLTNGGEGSSGVIISDETRQKMSFAKKNMSDETKQKILLASKGKKLSDEHKQKLLLASKGKKLSDETKLKISLSRKGKKFSDETKLKMSLSHKGKKFSDEHIQKISLVKKGKKQSKEIIEKRILKTTGKKRSDEMKLKMSLSRKAYLAKKKEEKLNQQNNNIPDTLE